MVNLTERLYLSELIKVKEELRNCKVLKTGSKNEDESILLCGLDDMGILVEESLEEFLEGSDIIFDYTSTEATLTQHGQTYTLQVLYNNSACSHPDIHFDFNTLSLV